MTPDIAEAIREQAEVIKGLAQEYVECAAEPAVYAWQREISKPHGVTFTQWGEEQCAVLASDITVLCELLLRLVEPGRVA